MLNFKGGKFMKKQIALATAAAMVLGLAACGSKPWSWRDSPMVRWETRHP